MRILLLVVCLLPILGAQSLEQAVRTRIAAVQGTVSLYAKNLDTGQSFGIRPSDPVRTASTIKLPILLTVFDQVAAGKARWNETLTIRPQDKVTGSGIIGTEFSDGVQLPLRDVVNLMIVLSDNSATNMVLERFTADSVNAYLDRLGLKNTRAMRKVRGDGPTLAEAEGWSAAGKLPENQKYGLGKSTPLDMVTILEKLERGEIVSPQASHDISTSSSAARIQTAYAATCPEWLSPTRLARSTPCAPKSQSSTPKAVESPWPSPWTICRNPNGHPIIPASC